MSESMMTVDELAEYLGTTRHAIYQRVHKAKGNTSDPNSIPFKKLGRSRTAPLRFKRSEIDAWMTPA